jgi:hypothetical protein
MNNILISVILLICLLLSPSTPLHAAVANDCHLKQYSSLDLLELPNGLLLVPVAIQDSHAFMILNTISGFSGVTNNAVLRFALPYKRIPSGLGVRFGSSPVEWVATAKGFSLGGLQFETADFTIIPNDTIGPHPDDVQIIGTLGMDVLAHVDVELDAANRKMNLFSQDHCAGNTVYWSNTYDSMPVRFGKLGELYFPMELDGKELETTLATGNTTTTLFADVAKKIYKLDRRSNGVQAEVGPVGTATTYYRAMELKGKGIQIINAHITLIDRPQNDPCHLGSRSGAVMYEGCDGVHPLQLGRNVLTKLRIYIAMKEKVLYFTSAAAK